MSMFLPDGPYQTQPPSGVADITPANPETTTADIALMQRVLSAASRNVNLIPSDFMAYIVDFIQTSRLQIPIGQVPGYTTAIPSGVIWALAGDTVPSGWILCDHSAYSRTAYAELFAAIGTTWGAGDGATTFNVPPAGLVWVGKDGSTEFSVVGKTGGEKTHILSVGEMPVHTHVQDAHNHSQNAHNHTQNAHGHGVSDPGHSHTLPSSGNNTGGSDPGHTTSKTSTDSAFTGVAVNDATATNNAATATNNAATATNQNAGSGAAHNNLQPYGVVNFIIKT